MDQNRPPLDLVRYIHVTHGVCQTYGKGDI